MNDEAKNEIKSLLLAHVETVTRETVDVFFKALEVIIKDSFLFAVFNTNIISSIPLQLFCVTKDHWIKSN